MVEPIPVLIPYVGLGMEKLRLARVLSPRERTALARDMLLAVIEAVRAARHAPVVVSPDPELRAGARDFGARFLKQRGLGLNEALTDASAALHSEGCQYLAVVHADLPLVTKSDIEALVDALPEEGIALAPDKTGSGTNALAVWLRHRQPFVFEGPSRARFEADAMRRGLSVAIVERLGLLHDLDDIEDLALIPMATRPAARHVAGCSGRPSSEGCIHGPPTSEPSRLSSRGGIVVNPSDAISNR